jgi:hypothetical protein
MKTLLPILILAAGLHAVSSYAGLNTEDYSHLRKAQIEEAAYNDALDYFKAHPNITTRDTDEIGSLQAHQHHLFGDMESHYDITFFQTLDARLKGE